MQSSRAGSRPSLNGPAGGAYAQLGNMKVALRNITGQLPANTKARISVANFNLRKGAVGGVMVTLRRDSLARFIKNYLYVAASPAPARSASVAAGFAGPKAPLRGALAAGALRAVETVGHSQTPRGYASASLSVAPAAGVTSFSVFPEARSLTALRGAHRLRATRPAGPTSPPAPAAGANGSMGLRGAILKGQLTRLSLKDIIEHSRNGRDTLRGRGPSGTARSAPAGHTTRLGAIGGGHIVFGFR